MTQGATRRMTLGELRHRGMMTGDPRWRRCLEEVMKLRGGKAWDSEEWIEIPEGCGKEEGQ